MHTHLTTLKNIATGVTGFAVSEVSNPIIDLLQNDPSDIAKIITQVVILVATIIGVFKRKKE